MWIFIQSHPKMLAHSLIHLQFHLCYMEIHLWYAAHQYSRIWWAQTSVDFPLGSSQSKSVKVQTPFMIYINTFSAVLHISISASGKRRHVLIFPLRFFNAKTLKCRIPLLCIHFIYETWNLINLIPDSGKHEMTESSAEHCAEIFSKTSEMVPNGLNIPMYES